MLFFLSWFSLVKLIITYYDGITWQASLWVAFDEVDLPGVARDVVGGQEGVEVNGQSWVSSQVSKKVKG